MLDRSIRKAWSQPAGASRSQLIPSRSQDTTPQDGPPPTYHGQASKWKHQVMQS